MRTVCLILLLALSIALPASARTLVRVGAYHFPPYMNKPNSDTASGLVPDLLALLNQVQRDYHFEWVPTAPSRRYSDFQKRRFDLILFESPKWGWQDTPLHAIDLQVEDADLYVARAEPGRDEAYFGELRGKRLALYNGYHYGFADYQADQANLTANYNARLTYSHDSNLQMLLRARADIALVTRSYLELYCERYPERSTAFLVSSRVDQLYRHYAMLHIQAPIPSQRFAALMQQVRSSGQLQPLLKRYHVAALPNVPAS